MERVVKSANGQWSIVDDAVEKSKEDEQKIIEIKRREMPERTKPLAQKVREIKQQNAAPKEPTLDEAIERKKKEYASALARSEQPAEGEEVLEKMRLLAPRGTDLDMPKNPQVGEWAMRSKAAASRVPGSPNVWQYHGYKDDPSHGQGRSTEEINGSQVMSHAQLFGHLNRIKMDPKLRDELIGKIQDSIGAHEVQHDILGHVSKQLKLTGNTHREKGDPKQRPLAQHLIAAAKLDPHEAHLLNTTLGISHSGNNLYDHPQEAIATLTEMLHGGPGVRGLHWQRVKDHLPGETVHGFSNRLKAIHSKIQNVMNGLSKDKDVEVPSDVDYLKSIHGAGWGAADNGDGTVTPSHQYLNEHPSFAGHKFNDLKAGYVPHGAPLAPPPAQPVKKSVSWSVAAGLQPSSEQWEAAAAQMLGLPTDTASAELLAKRAEAQWQNAIADSFKQLSQPVEAPKVDWGRGPVDQNDESKLSEEERRIRAIPVSPDAMKD